MYDIYNIYDLSWAKQDIIGLAANLGRRDAFDITGLDSIPEYPQNDIYAPNWSYVGRKEIKWAGMYDFTLDTTFYVTRHSCAEPGILGLEKKDYKTAYQRRQNFASDFNRESFDAYCKSLLSGLELDGSWNTVIFPDQSQAAYGLGLVFFRAAQIDHPASYSILNLRRDAQEGNYIFMNKMRGQAPARFALFDGSPADVADKITSWLADDGYTAYGGMWQIGLPQRQFN